MFGSGLAFPNAIGICLSVFPKHIGSTSSLAIGALTTLGGLLTEIVAKIPADVNYALPSFISVLVVLMVILVVYFRGYK